MGFWFWVWVLIFFFLKNRKGSRILMLLFIWMKKIEKWLFFEALELFLLLFVVFLFIGKWGEMKISFFY